MNENTIKIRIAEITERLNNSFDAVEQATLSEDLKKLRKELSALKNKDLPKKEVRLKTNIDAPIIGDSENAVSNGRTSFVPSDNGTFISMI